VFNESTALQGPKDLFDVRLKISRHTNPLRAKILIFSILYHPFKFSTRDWLTLKMQDLDNLIRHLYSICPTPAELEERLHETARKLNRKEEDLMTASVIFKAMKPLYKNPEIDNPEPVFSSNEGDGNPQLDNENDRVEPNDSNSDLDDDETQLLDLENPHLVFDGKPLQSFLPSNFKNQIENPSDRAPNNDDDLTEPLFLSDLDEVSETISYDSGELASPKVGKIVEAEVGDSDSNYPIFSREANNDRGKITASFLRQIDLEDDVRHLINEQAQKVRKSLLDAVQYVEQELDRISNDRSPNDRISIKYPALQQLTDTLSAHLTQIQNILTVQAKAAIVAPPPPPSSIAPFNSQPTTLPATPQSIVALLNPILKPQGIKTFATQKEGCLHIVLETYGISTLQKYPTLNPQKLIAFVRAALLEVNLEAFDRIKVYGRKLGNKSPDWIQTISLSK
jgi:hypothetical protein